MIIFISYTQKCNKDESGSKDEDIVKKFEKIVKNDKDNKISVSIWRDVNILKSGDEFNDEIYRGILNCDIFVPFLSKNSINAKGVIKEIHSALFHSYAIKDKSPNYIKPVLIKDYEIKKLDSLTNHKTDELVEQLVNDIKNIQYFPIERNNFKNDLNKFYKKLKGSLCENNLWKISGYCNFNGNDDRAWTLTYKPGYPSIVSYFLKERESIKEIKAVIDLDQTKNWNTRVGISLRRHNGNPNDELFRFHIAKNKKDSRMYAAYYTLEPGEVNCISDRNNRPPIKILPKNTLFIKVEERKIYCYL